MKRGGSGGIVACVAIAVWSCSSGSSAPAGTSDAAVIDEGYLPTGDDGSEGCVLDGSPCPDAGACCAGVCSAGVCGATDACAPAGAACSTPDTCCSRACTASACADTD
ncbi:MAG TPA: hypothetical protein VGG39_25510 [Polyangiaceae bacterium]